MSLTVRQMLARLRDAYHAEEPARRRNRPTPGECSRVYPGDLAAHIVSGVDAAKEQEQ